MTATSNNSNGGWLEKNSNKNQTRLKNRPGNWNPNGKASLNNKRNWPSSASGTPNNT